MSVQANPELTLLLGYLEKALVKHLCEGEYSKLAQLTVEDILRAVLGPQVATNICSHDMLASMSVWSQIK